MMLHFEGMAASHSLNPFSPLNSWKKWCEDATSLKFVDQGGFHETGIRRPDLEEAIWSVWE